MAVILLVAAALRLPGLAAGRSADPAPTGMFRRGKPPHSGGGTSATSGRRSASELGWPLPGFADRFRFVASTLAQSLRDRPYWDGRAVPLSPWEDRLGWIVIGAVYRPGRRARAWAARPLGPARRPPARPWQAAWTWSVVAFWFTVAAQL